jgi:hypothetical protein
MVLVILLGSDSVGGQKKYIYIILLGSDSFDLFWVLILEII